MSPTDILVLGSINTDLVVKGSRLPAAGETVVGGEFYQAPGGKGANQAVAAVRASRQIATRLIAAVGEDAFGRAALQYLRQVGVQCDGVLSLPGVPSGVALIMVDQQGQNCISVASGANSRLTVDHLDRLPDQLFAKARVLLACLEAPLDIVHRGLQRAKAAGLITILDPAPADPCVATSEWLQYVDLLTPNESEASLLVGETVRDVPSAAEAGRRLNTLGSSQTVVTLGAGGCVLVSDRVTHVPALSVRPVDATAAGDAFNGALAVALAEGRDLETACRWATVAAGLSVTRTGAQPSLPTRQAIDAAIQDLDTNWVGAEV